MVNAFGRYGKTRRSAARSRCLERTAPSTHRLNSFGYLIVATVVRCVTVLMAVRRNPVVPISSPARPEQQAESPQSPQFGAISGRDRTRLQVVVVWTPWSERDNERTRGAVPPFKLQRPSATTRLASLWQVARDCVPDASTRNRRESGLVISIRIVRTSRGSR